MLASVHACIFVYGMYGYGMYLYVPPYVRARYMLACVYR